MKLDAFRRKDQVHLLDMISLGMIDETWLELYPEKLRLPVHGLHAVAGQHNCATS